MGITSGKTEITGSAKVMLEKHESVESIGILNLNFTRDIDPDLDCTSGPRANPPSPPPYDDNAQAAAPSFNLYPDLTAKKAPANSATGVMAVRHTFSVHGDQ
ncbi:unnamed protein product [Arctogadus glacialis]